MWYGLFLSFILKIFYCCCCCSHTNICSPLFFLYVVLLHLHKKELVEDADHWPTMRWKRIKFHLMSWKGKPRTIVYSTTTLLAFAFSSRPVSGSLEKCLFMKRKTVMRFFSPWRVRFFVSWKCRRKTFCSQRTYIHINSALHKKEEEELEVGKRRAIQSLNKGNRFLTVKSFLLSLTFLIYGNWNSIATNKMGWMATKAQKQANESNG